MKSPERIVREARLAAGLTQAELARRMGTTQSAVARLEARGANPRLRTLERAVRATGRHIDLSVSDHPPGNVDETLIFEALRVSPAERLRGFEQSYRGFRELARAGARARGRVA